MSIAGVDTNHLVVPGGVGALPVAAGVGGGGEDEDVGVFGVADRLLEIGVTGYAAREPEGHGDDVDLPNLRCVGNCLSEGLIDGAGKVSGGVDVKGIS